jgi:hypothetical protein
MAFQESLAALPITKTGKFKKWFQGSKIVDAEGKPLVVYHATAAENDFSRFNKRVGDIGNHFGTLAQAEDRSEYSTRFNDEAPSRIMPVYLSIKRPLRLRDAGAWNADNLKHQLLELFPNDAARIGRNFVNEGLKSTKDIREFIQSNGYDGVVYANTGETAGAKEYREAIAIARSALESELRALGKPSHVYDTETQATPRYVAYSAAEKAYQDFREKNAEDSYISFSPTQIKSAIGNNGSFDPNNPDIRFSLSPEKLKNELLGHQAAFKAKFGDFDEASDTSYDDRAQFIAEAVTACGLVHGVRAEMTPWAPYGQTMGVELTDLFADEPGLGGGTKVMQLLGELSDALEISIYLKPSSQRNREFYARFGFEEGKRETRGMLTRYPELAFDDDDERDFGGKSNSQNSKETAYLLAVARGDMAAAQELVDAAAKAAGYDSPKVFHGTGAAFVAFDPAFTGQGEDQLGSGFYFTTDIVQAKAYQTKIQSVDKPKLGGDLTPNTVSSYLALKNPIRLAVEQETLREVKITAAQVLSILKSAPNVYDGEESPLANWFDNDGKAFTNAQLAKVSKDYVDLISLENDFFKNDATAFRQAVFEATGHDGVVKEQPNGSQHYVAWFPSQIKSSEPLTRDSQGRLIGLEGRFKADLTDIRFSLAADVDEDVMTPPNPIPDEHFESEPHDCRVADGITA